MKELLNYVAWGTKNIRGDVLIETGVNDVLSLDVDGVPYNLVLDAGKYHTLREKHESELVDALNQKAIAQSIPIDIVLGGSLDDNGKVNYVVFGHKNAGGTIDNFRGSMKSLIFV